MSNDRQPKRRATVYTVLLSVCLFFAVISACLLVALVLVGKNLAAHSLPRCPDDHGTSDSAVVASAGDKTVDRETVDDETRGQRSFSTDEDILNLRIKVLGNATSDADQSRSGWRLPRDVVPVHYDLYFRPDLASGLFFGSANITVNVTVPRDHIILHAHLLNVSKVRLHSGDTGEEIEVLTYHEDVVHQLQVVDLEDSLPPGEYHLFFEFGGSTRDRIVGLYESSYLDMSGNKRYMATSKLEPTYARQAFPCFDEPNFKAKYTVRLVKPVAKEYIALSNMNQVGEPEMQPDNQTALVTFNTSVPMSSYLACFIVCDFTYRETTVKASVGNDVLLRVYATPAQKSKTEFALQIAKDITAYYIDYFKIEYPLPKLDMIAIPDFVSGAMEHWGLVTYRETALLFDKKSSSTMNQQRVAMVVAHELAHMWFGNLVTLNWWNDLWLNEGFANYMQFKATDHVLKEWNLMDQFLVEQLHPVLEYDSSVSSHPIVQKVVTPDEITELFDIITYTKGSSILRMLESAVGEDKFQNAISNYLNKYKYSNAVTKNFWDELKDINVDFNVHDVMATWTEQMGYPVVNVMKTGNEYVLTQKRFLSDPENNNYVNTHSSYGYKWTIPITYVTDKKQEKTFEWFDKLNSELKITIPDAKWVKFNAKQIGFYRVNYTEEIWKTLSENIKSMDISDRTCLFEDSFSIAKTGQLSYDVPLSMTQHLKEEEAYIVWKVTSSKLLELNKLLINTEINKNFKIYVRSLIKPFQEGPNWHENENDKHHQKLARITIMHLSCQMGDKTCLSEVSKQFKSWLYDNAQLSQDMKSIVYYFGMVNGNVDDWDKLFEKYQSETDAQEKMKLLNALAAIQDPSVLSRLIDYAKNETIVRGQDYFSCLKYISDNPLGTPVVWDYVRDNWEDLVERFTLNNRYLGQLIPYITSRFASKIKLVEMEDFFKRYPDAGAGTSSRKQALERVSNNIKWLQKYTGQIETWINKHVQ